MRKKDWWWSWSSNTLATWCEELAHCKRLWCWERLGSGGKGEDWGWDRWVASPAQWTWVWVSSGRWQWRTGKPGELQFMGLQRVGHNWGTQQQQHEKEGNPASWVNMDRPWGHCAKWDKSEKDKLNMISLICGILKSYTNREWDGGYRNQGQRNYGDNGQRLHTFSYKMNKSWRSNAQHYEYSQQYCFIPWSC